MPDPREERARALQEDSDARDALAEEMRAMERDKTSYQTKNLEDTVKEKQDFRDAVDAFWGDGPDD